MFKCIHLGWCYLELHVMLLKLTAVLDMLDDGVAVDDWVRGTCWKAGGKTEAD